MAEAVSKLPLSTDTSQQGCGRVEGSMIFLIEFIVSGHRVILLFSCFYSFLLYHKPLLKYLLRQVY